MADFEDSARHEADDYNYDRRDRSASPRGERDERQRSRSPNGRAPPPPPHDTRMPDAEDEEGASNPGTNLFVTGIHPRLTESDIVRLFEKYGEVENCSIMLDPHTKESRGFGFVKMKAPDQADAAREGLQGEVIEGRTMSIEKARRARPRTPTPGKYFGPPKRGDFGDRGRGGSRGGYGGRDRYDDRRGGYGGRRDEYRGSRNYDDNYRGGSRYHDDYDGRSRGYGGGSGRRDEGYSSSRNIDRYEGGRRDEGYGASRERRGGGAPARDYASSGRDYGHDDFADRGDRGGDRSYGGGR